MPGRQDRSDEAWDRDNTGHHLASLNGTGKHPVPQRSPRPQGLQRPPTMKRVEQPPPVPRVGRPMRQPPAKGFRRGLLIWGSVIITSALLACFAGYLIINLSNAIGNAADPAKTATDFLQALSDRNYDQAYNDLGATITLEPNMDRQHFKQEAQRIDNCYGVIKNYTLVNGSGEVTDTSQSYSYTITREKLAGPYELRITLQKDQQPPNAGSWRITSYGGSLAPPAQSSCK